jgi:hypothetical protein
LPELIWVDTNSCASPLYVGVMSMTDAAAAATHSTTALTISQPRLTRIAR